MLTLTVPACSEMWDNEREEFLSTKETVLQLEHSLVSVSKWEAKYKKPFLNNKGFSGRELMDYVKFMTITQNVDPNVYLAMTRKNLKDVEAYIQDSMTATTFSKTQEVNSMSAGKQSRNIVTNELIYYWMFSLQIPKECEKWHLNRLMTLIRVFDAKNKEQEQSHKHPNPKAAASHHASVNAARRKH